LGIMDEMAVILSMKSYDVGRASWLHTFNNNSNFNANNRNIDSHNRLRGITHITAETSSLKTNHRDLWNELCSINNLELAYRKARKHKTKKPYVLEFERNLKGNLLLLRTELLLHSYIPKPLETFILRDPKTRRISKSDFRDKIIHHALCTIIEPFFEKVFIYDSYANRKGKGALKAIKRFEYFLHRLSRNNTAPVFALKSDICHYFDETDHAILLLIIKKRIKDQKVAWLIKRILSNYSTREGKGMPLGNLTSQFFANVYLNEMDQFVKHILRAQHYIRYVDDFVLLHTSKEKLIAWKQTISMLLHGQLLLSLHPEKTKIMPVHHGVNFLGMKIFPHHKILARRNIRSYKKKTHVLCEQYDKGMVSYDVIYDSLEGWVAYTKHADAHKMRERLVRSIGEKFFSELSTKEFNRLHKAIS